MEILEDLPGANPYKGQCRDHTVLVAVGPCLGASYY
jgi:hypothetical protein